jgi:protease-4
VDELGGLGKALEIAAELAEIDEYNLTSYPKIETDFVDLFSLMSPVSSIQTEIKTLLPKEVNAFINAVSVENSHAPRIQAQIPFSLDIN